MEAYFNRPVVEKGYSKKAYPELIWVLKEAN